MKATNSQAFVNHLLVYTIVLIFCSGSIGFGTVWLRHEISVTANRNKNLETKIAELERHIARVNSEIAAAQSPEVLVAAAQRLGLVPPREGQVQRVNERVDERLAAKRHSEIFSTATPVMFRLGGTR